MSYLTRNNAVLPFPTSSSQATSLEGLVVGLLNDELVELPEAGAAPLGVCINFDEAGSPASVALMSGGLGGTVKVLTGTAVSTGDYLVIGTAGAVDADSGAGARTQVGQALESGSTGEMIEAVLFHPVSLT
jgi:hypothetical protein